MIVLGLKVHQKYSSSHPVPHAYPGYTAIFLRGIHEAYNRSTNSALKTLIHSYLDVQVGSPVSRDGITDTNGESQV